jgi:hypothetical protein
VRPFIFDLKTSHKEDSMKKVLCALFILMGTVPAFAAELEVVDPSDLPAPVVGEKAEVTAPVVAAAAQATPSITRAEDETMLTAAQRGKKVMPEDRRAHALHFRARRHHRDRCAPPPRIFR